MRSTTQPMDETVAVGRPWWAELAELTKIRLTVLVLLTTLVGFLLGLRGPLDGWLLLLTLIGTGFLAGGASTLNQWLEREWDVLMERTRERPLPAQRMQPRSALAIGVGSSVVGILTLALGVGLATAALGALTLGLYLFVYTPLKRSTTLNTIVGALPGPGGRGLGLVWDSVLLADAPFPRHCVVVPRRVRAGRLSHVGGLR